MAEILAKNKEISEAFKSIIGLRHEPVAVKLVKKGEAFPGGFPEPEKQLSHCQAVFSAKNGQGHSMPLSAQGCMVGACTLGMTPRPDKVKSGEFHYGIGIHETVGASGEMFDSIVDVPYETDGEVVCPLKDADFVPDVVIVVDMPERVYWFEALHLRSGGGRIPYLTAPFQCACADVTSFPLVKGHPNISIGCFGCRKKTDMKADEMAIGIPYALIPKMYEDLKTYKDGVLTKAKRD